MTTAAGGTELKRWAELRLARRGTTNAAEQAWWSWLQVPPELGVRLRSAPMVLTPSDIEALGGQIPQDLSEAEHVVVAELRSGERGELVGLEGAAWGPAEGLGDFVPLIATDDLRWRREAIGYGLCGPIRRFPAIVLVESFADLTLAEASVQAEPSVHVICPHPGASATCWSQLLSKTANAALMAVGRSDGKGPLEPVLRAMTMIGRAVRILPYEALGATGAYAPAIRGLVEFVRSEG